ncbi:histidine kinase [Aurantiacibacter arachoides]|nr:histidine kinase [Aurantiacibacter arachoides]
MPAARDARTELEEGGLTQVAAEGRRIMINREAILLFIGDRPVLSSLQFSLAVEGFQVVDAAADEIDPTVAAALVIDQTYLGDGVAVLRDLRMQGFMVPAIVLATNPNAELRARVNAMSAELIEKPLLGDELSHAIRALLAIRKAA